MTKLKGRWTLPQIIVHGGAFVPLLWLAWDFWQGQTSLLINPFHEITLRTGKAALILLLLSLSCRPLNTVFAFKQVLKLRKSLGLYAFMYGLLHFLVFVVDNGLVANSFNLLAVYQATFEKRYALAGFSALMILLILALTSNQWSMKRLGKNWDRLHRLAYLAGIMAIIHFIWLVKADIREPLVYGAILALLLGLRIPGVKKYVGQIKTAQS